MIADRLIGGLAALLKKIPLDLGQGAVAEHTEGKQIALRLVPPGDGRAALDVGCREGHQSRWLTSRGYVVTSIDLEPSMPGAMTVNVDLGLPFALEQGWLDVMPVQGGDVDALGVAIERQLLADWLEVFNIAGVRLGRLVPAQVAWMVGLQERLLAADSTTLVGLLLPEPQALRLLVWRDGVPLYERLLSGELEQWLGQLEACLRFLRWQQGSQATGSIELLLAAGLAAGQQERLQLGCPQPLELLDSGGYGNLALRGLALLEGAR